MGKILQVGDLIMLGGEFYSVDGESFCDTARDTWKLVPGVGYVLIDQGFRRLTGEGGAGR